MARNPKPSLSNLVVTRKLVGENQQSFWSKFGVTQSGGSRYESGRAIPLPTKLLMQLYFDGVIDAEALAKAKRTIAKKT